ncbi:hypothetical protein LTR27_001283 [Elasticomyces elasticus]|nr:hypothetical protein LTR27_001283 [Elasticomyces elasticus]
MLSSIFGRPVPTGSGDLAQSAYGPFIDGLTEGVLALRRTRALYYHLLRAEREHKDVAMELDDAEVKRIEDELKHPRQRRRANLPEHDANIAKLRPTFEQTAQEVEQLREQLAKSRKEARDISEMVFSLEAQVTNDVFRPDLGVILNLHSSPGLFSQLRLAKAGEFLLKQCEAAVRTAEEEVRKSAAELRSDASRLKTLAGDCEQPPPDMLELMAELQRRMDAHRGFLHGQVVAQARAYRRDIDQRNIVEELFLDIAAPVLEADGRVPEDQLHSALLDRDENGERFVYQITLDYRLTDAQRDRYLDNFHDWYNEANRRRNVLDGLLRRRDETLASFWVAQPDAMEPLADPSFEEARLIAEEMLKQAEDFTIVAAHILRDAGELERRYRFCDDAADGRQNSERSSQQRIRLGRADRNGIGAWARDVAGSVSPAISRGSPDIWPSEPVEFGDNGAYDFYWLPEDEEWMRSALIKMENRVAERIRRGLWMTEHSASEIDSQYGSEVWCCGFC